MAHKILLVYAHPAAGKSRANAALIDAARRVSGVTVHDLYAAYPDLFVHPARERKLLLEHDGLVFQHPLYWYSAPALLKEWLDLVLTHGFAYGDEGRALRGKHWMQAVTAGGRREAYRPDGSHRFPVEELLRPFEATAHLCQCVWRTPFVLHASHLVSDDELAREADAYRMRLETLVHSLSPTRELA